MSAPSGAIGGPPAIHVGSRYRGRGPSPANVNGEIRVVADFLTALKCYELLNSHQNIQKDLQRLLASWRSDTWTWFNEFHIDLSIYQGMFSEAAHAVTHPVHPSRSRKEDLRRHLQLASSLFCLGKYANAVERALVILSLLGSTESECNTTGLFTGNTSGLFTGNTSGLFTCLPTEDPPVTPGRLVQLLPCTDAPVAKGDLVSYCIELIITALKTRIFNSGIQDDRTLGHLIVVSQYAWPKYSNLFLDVIKRIQRQSSFAYSVFFSYVVVIDILEEFAYLRNSEGGRVSLDILPVTSGGKTLTRGANRGANEDFRSHIERQVHRTNEIDFDAVMTSFFTQEHSSLLQMLE